MRLRTISDNQGRVVVEYEVHESCKDAHLKYATWCVDGGLKNVSKPIFGRELKKLGYNSDRVIKKGGKSIRVWSITK